ncbi:MAG: hypothetical protein KAY78_02840 [Pseudomonadales bacterium]|nr:hypothetical protein [Pseudomonadales bacterium]
MAEDNKLKATAGVDTTDFKTGIAAMNRDLRVLESGFKASAAALGDWSSDATGLESRIKSLNGQMEIQAKKVDATRKEWERVKQEKGDTSRAAQELEIKLNKETETLGKMTNELGNTEAALQDMQSGADDAGSSVDELGTKTNDLGSVLSGLGTFVSGAVTALVAVATAAIAAGAAIAGLVFTASTASNDLADLSAKTGISTERLQELAYIGDQVGTSQETITGSLARLIRTMDGAQTQYADYEAAQAEAVAKGEEFDGKLGDSAAAFDRLGVSVTDSSGNLRDNEAVFADLIDALGKVPNEAERDALAMSLFGKSAQELNPLIKTGSAEMANLAAEARELGAVVSEEDVSALADFQDMLDGMKMGLQGTLATLATAFLPGFQQIFGQAQGYVKEFAAIVSGSNGDLGQIAQGLGGLIGTIISDVAAQAPQMLEAGLGILQSIIDAIITNLPVMIPAAINIIMSLLDFIIQNLPTLIEAALQIIIALANGITQALPTLIPAIVQALTTIVTVLVENLPMLIDAALQLILALAQGLVAAIPILIPAIPVIVQAILDAFVQALPMIALAAVELIKTLAFGVRDNTALLLASVVELIAVLLNYLFVDAPKMFQNVGKNLITGIWEGIKSNMAWLKANFVSEIMKVVGAVKVALGIKSPSDYMADQVGEHLPTGIAEGWDKRMPDLRRKMAGSMRGLSDVLNTNVTANVAGSAAGGIASAASGSSFSFGDIIVNVPGTSATPQQIAVATQDGVLAALRSKGAI